jgi:hypothetical protein
MLLGNFDIALLFCDTADELTGLGLSLKKKTHWLVALLCSCRPFSYECIFSSRASHNNRAFSCRSGFRTYCKRVFVAWDAKS